MRSIFLLVFIGILFYCSEKDVFKKLKQTGGEPVEAAKLTVLPPISNTATNHVPIMIGVFAIVVGGAIAGYFVFYAKKKWKCDSSTKKCAEDPTGSYDKKAQCDTACADGDDVDDVFSHFLF